MFADFFLHPAFMIAGAALVSAPIIIHLINRMRYKRIRWAAMEFLLKSQKRNRRRLIIEQLILLALRCVLVALAGFLVARFIGGIVGPGAENPVVHLVVLDDTLSMSDTTKEPGAAQRTAFDMAKARVKDIAAEANKATSPQYLRLVTLSSLKDFKPLTEEEKQQGAKAEEEGVYVFNKRLNNDTLKELDDKLGQLQKPSLLHVAPVEGVRWARAQKTEASEQRNFHLVSDLRESDWGGPEAETLNKEIDGFTGAGGKAMLFDVALPARQENQPVALHNDNIGISDLRPETRFTAEGLPVQFTCTIKNYSAVVRKDVFINVTVNGETRFEATQPIPQINPGDNKWTFLLAFNKEGANMVAASLAEKDSGGIPEDNIRVACIEVKKQVPVLVIDGSDKTDNYEKDSFYLQAVLSAAKGFQVVQKAKEDLDALDLSQYPCVYLLNVPQVSEKAAKRLEGYVEKGGHVAFFLGDKVQASQYNKLFYANGNGIFPAPLEARPTPPIDDTKKFERMFENQFQLFIRNPADNPVFKEFADPKNREWFKFLVIGQTWPTEPHFKWAPDPDKRVKELATLPNRKEARDYNDAFIAVRTQLLALLEQEKFEKFKPTVSRYLVAMNKAVAESQLAALGTTLDGLLNEHGDPKNPAEKPDLSDLWNDPANDKLRGDVAALRDTVMYGDPLVLSKSFGKGETVVFLTTAGKAWNEWPGGCPASGTYPVVMLSLQRHLTGVTDDSGRFVGSPLELALDPESYEDKAAISFQPAPAEVKNDGAAPPVGAESARKELETIQGKVENGQLKFAYAKTRQPGLYFAVVKPKPREGEKEPAVKEEVYAFNVDTEAEGNLKRAAKDSLEHSSPGQAHGPVTLITPDMNLNELLAPKRKDMSEAPWLYLVILIILIVEQALAVHLSFHLKGNEAQMPAGVTGEARTPVPATDAA